MKVCHHQRTLIAIFRGIIKNNSEVKGLLTKAFCRRTLHIVAMINESAVPTGTNINDLSPADQ